MDRGPRVRPGRVLGSLDGLRRRAAASGEISPIRLHDGSELHLGAEYAFLGAQPIVALRLGVWLDPDHRLAFNERGNQLERALRPEGENENELHVAAGVGIALRLLQIDLAVDRSELVDTASISAIYTF